MVDLNLIDFGDLAGDILVNFSIFPDLLLSTELFDTPLWVIVTGAGLGLYLGWLVIKFAIGLS